MNSSFCTSWQKLRRQEALPVHKSLNLNLNLAYFTCKIIFCKSYFFLNMESMEGIRPSFIINSKRYAKLCKSSRRLGFMHFSWLTLEKYKLPRNIVAILGTICSPVFLSRHLDANPKSTNFKSFSLKIFRSGSCFCFGMLTLLSNMILCNFKSL